MTIIINYRDIKINSVYQLVRDEPIFTPRPVKCAVNLMIL